MMIATAIPNAMEAVNIKPPVDVESYSSPNESLPSGIQNPSASCVPDPQASPQAASTIPSAASTTSPATASAASATSSATASAASATYSAASTTSSIAAAFTVLNEKLVEALFMS